MAPLRVVFRVELVFHVFRAIARRFGHQKWLCNQNFEKSILLLWEVDFSSRNKNISNFDKSCQSPPRAPLRPIFRVEPVFHASRVITRRFEHQKWLWKKLWKIDFTCKIDLPKFWLQSHFWCRKRRVITLKTWKTGSTRKIGLREAPVYFSTIFKINWVEEKFHKKSTSHNRLCQVDFANIFIENVDFDNFRKE